LCYLGVFFSKKYDVEVEVWDWDRESKNQIIGKVNINMEGLLAKQNQDQWLTLTNKEKDVGKIHLKTEIKNKEEVEKDFWIDFATHFDRDSSKTISFMEFSAIAEALGIHPQKGDEVTNQLFSSGVLNENSELTFDAFYQLMKTDDNNVPTSPLLATLLPENAMEFIWEATKRTINHKDSIGLFMLEGGFYGQIHTATKRKQDKILIVDRETGKLKKEKIPQYISISLKMMYSTKSGRFAFDKNHLGDVLKHLSEQQGRKYDSPQSVKEIPKFIEFHGLNVDEILDPLDSFKNFNEFFYRKLKSTARTISDSHVISPGDCRCNVFSTLDEASKIWIKGKNFTLSNLLKNKELEDKFKGASLLICRLAPQDYHRFHVPVNGKLISLTPYNGTYYTVNPVAINEDVDVYTENKRMLAVIETPEFGEVLYIAVGATLVGSISFTREVGEEVKRGEEMGYFAFGGSTILVLFQSGSIVFDEDLLVNSTKPIETLIKMGESVGKSAK